MKGVGPKLQTQRFQTSCTATRPPIGEVGRGAVVQRFRRQVFENKQLA
jgi:hypothetical protein